MRTRSKLMLAGLTAGLLLASAVAAQGTTLSFSGQPTRIAWSSFEFISGELTVRCPATLEGSFHSSTIRKTSGALIGYMTRATIPQGSCTSGRAFVNQEALPWHVRYRGFRGTLPSLTGMTQGFIGAKLTVEFAGASCVGQTTATNPAVGTSNVEATNGRVTGFSFDASAAIPLRGGFFCELAPGHLGGTGRVTQLGSTSAVFIRLGEFVPYVEPSLSPSPVAFGTIAAEGIAARTVTITAGSESLTVNRISIGMGSNFAILDPNRCAGARLEARATCAFKAIFAAPRETGRSFETTLSVETTIATLVDSVSAST